MLDSLDVAAFLRVLEAPRRHRPGIGFRYTEAFSLLLLLLLRMASSALGNDNDKNVWSQRKDLFYGFPGG